MPPLALLNPVPLAFAIATTFGVLMHDTRVDHATKIAISAPAPAAEYAGSETSKINDQQHVHVEKVSVGSLNAARSANPRTQVRDDDYRYIQPKRLIGGADDKTTLWPSV